MAVKGNGAGPPRSFVEAMAWQAAFCDRAAAPVTAAVCRVLGEALDTGSVTGARAIGWQGDWQRDALPLRLVAPLHALHRRGYAPLAALFAGDAVGGVAAVRTTIAEHDAWIATWLASPPQTNEPGRSACFVGALHVLAARYGHAADLLEIGSSAGLNLLVDRYRYDLGGVVSGPPSPVMIRPAWRGPPPPSSPVTIARVRGVDIAPLDVRDPAAAERLLAYVWIDTPERIARVDAAIAMITDRAVDMVQGDAADWIEARLAEPQLSGQLRVVMHSIVWQYPGEERQARITQAIEAAGVGATPDRPLAWIAFETAHPTDKQLITLRSWPGGGNSQILGHAHPHGTWIDWNAQLPPSA